MLVRDQLHRKIVLSAPPQRIISLVPSQTELLVDLGLQDRLVGITKFCVYPSSLRDEIAIVGGTKQVKIERVQSLAPDLIICNKEENTSEMVQALEKIAPVWVSDVVTFDQSLDLIYRLGSLFSVEVKASSIIDNIKDEFKSFQSSMSDMAWVKTAYLIWKNPYMIAGRNCFINEMLRFNKFDNLIKDPQSRYPEVTIEDLKEADLILLSSEPFPFREKDVSEMSELLENKVHLVDGTYFSWYGSRLREAFAYFKKLQRDIYISARE
jgi:iron complex transport system substrate-binding protein